MHTVASSDGEGRPVVLIHGWPFSGESWWSSYLPPQRALYRVVTYDRRGFGQSDPGDGYDYDVVAGDLDNVLSDLDLTDVRIVGFSMGGGEVATLRLLPSARTDWRQRACSRPPCRGTCWKTDDNPDGPLTEDAARGDAQRTGGGARRVLRRLHQSSSSPRATTSRSQPTSSARPRVTLCQQWTEDAALGCMDAFDRRGLPRGPDHNRCARP